MRKGSKPNGIFVAPWENPWLVIHASAYFQRAYNDICRIGPEIVPQVLIQQGLAAFFGPFPHWVAAQLHHGSIEAVSKVIGCPIGKLQLDRIIDLKGLFFGLAQFFASTKNERSFL
jgi:hypothetical protein